jgi:hypothetical protein
MAVQLAAPVIGREPARDKRGAGSGFARLVIPVGAGMRGIGVARVEEERPLDLGDALRDVAQLDPRPAEVGQEPPILVPARRQGFEERQLGLVEIGPAAEAEEAKNAERQG